MPEKREWTPFSKYLWYLEKVIFPEMGYEPTDEQWKVHRAVERVRLVAGGERAGKSRASSADLAARAAYMAFLEDEKEKADREYRRVRQLYWILGPDYTQPRAEFEYVMGDLQRMGFPLIGKPSMPRGGSAPWSMEVGNVGEITTKTSADLKKIASYAPDGILMAEAAQQDYDAYLKSRGRVAEKRGWLLMSGTFESSLGWYADTYTAWKAGFGTNRSFSLPTWSNLRIYPGGREDPEIKALEAVTPAAIFDERYGAVPHKPSTLVFREFSYEDNVKDWCVFNPDLPVQLAVDPGYSPSAYNVSAIQVHGVADGPEQVWHFDEIYINEKTGPEVIEMCKKRLWWGNVTGGVMDIAGRQHHGMSSQITVWRELAGIHLRSNVVPILDGIERHRTFIRDPGTGKPRLFHNPSCVNTLREYSRYQRPKDREGISIKEIPVDRHNHALKSLAYILYDIYGPVQRAKRRTSRVATL